MYCYKQFCVLLFVFGFAICADRRWCNTQTDCHSNECCLSNNPPRGKRLLSSNHLGHCVPLGQTGDSCYVRYGSSSTPPSAVIYGCPCHNPLVCHGLHVMEVPLGEIGRCG